MLTFAKFFQGIDVIMKSQAHVALSLIFALVLRIETSENFPISHNGDVIFLLKLGLANRSLAYLKEYAADNTNPVR